MGKLRGLILLGAVAIICAFGDEAGAQFAQQGTKLVGRGAVGSAHQGIVALSGDGNTAIVGGPSDSVFGGAVWVFTRTGSMWQQQGGKLVGTGGIGDIGLGSSVALSGDGNTAIVGGSGDSSGRGAVWIFVRSGGVWKQQGEKLVGTGAIGSAYQGGSVALSGDGNTAIVGGVGDNNLVGAAWIFTRSGGIWSQQGDKLVGTDFDVVAPLQAASVSISADGNTAIVGAPNDNGAIGAAWIFTRSGDVWNQQGEKLVGTRTVGENHQGSSVALSADGSTAVVGGTQQNSSGIGATWIFIRTNGVWSQQGDILVGSGAVGTSMQGCSVSISADGNTALVGGYYDNGYCGATWVFTRSGSVWTQQGSKLVGSGAAGAHQGQSVSLSSDGNTAIVGGPYVQGDFYDWPGAAWVFTRSGSVWSQQGEKLVGTGAVGMSRQGGSVSLSADGNTVIEGGYRDSSSAGAVWVFVRNAGAWEQQREKLVGTEAVGSAFQGASVSLSGDGNTAIVGGPVDSSHMGAVWIFTRSEGMWRQQGKKLVGAGAAGYAAQGYSVSLSQDGNTALVGGPDDNNGVGAAWVFTRSGETWNQQGDKLVGSNAVGLSRQGFSVSLSADGTIALVGGYGDNDRCGAAWVFTRSGDVWTQQGNKLIGSSATGASRQGSSVSISGNGNTAIIGGPSDSSGAGAVWIFVRNDSAWSQQGVKLVGADAIGNAAQGYSVSLSADGNTALVGGYYDNGYCGATWVFTRSGSAWTQKGDKLVGSDGGCSWQGCSVALSADGNTSVVGGEADNNGAGATWVFIRTAEGIEGCVTMLPRVFSLGQNYPNPFNPSTTIKFELPRASQVNLSVYDVLGRQVSVLVNERSNAGVHEIKFDASGLSSGVYFYRLTTGDFVQTRRFILLK